MIGDILQPTHLLFILVIALLVLGPKRLPEVGRSLGRGMRDFRNAISGDDHHDDDHDQQIAVDTSAHSADPAPHADSAPDLHTAGEPVTVPEPIAAPQPTATPPTNGTQQPTAQQPAATEEPAERLG